MSQVIDLPPSEILPAPAFGTKLKVDFLNGMGKSGNKFVLILDIEKVLSGEQLKSTPALNYGEPAMVSAEELAQ